MSVIKRSLRSLHKNPTPRRAVESCKPLRIAVTEARDAEFCEARRTGSSIRDSRQPCEQSSSISTASSAATISAASRTESSVSARRRRTKITRRAAHPLVPLSRRSAAQRRPGDWGQGGALDRLAPRAEAQAAARADPARIRDGGDRRDADARAVAASSARRDHRLVAGVQRGCHQWWRGPHHLLCRRR